MMFTLTETEDAGNEDSEDVSLFFELINPLWSSDMIAGLPTRRYSLEFQDSLTVCEYTTMINRLTKPYNIVL